LFAKKIAAHGTPFVLGDGCRPFEVGELSGKSVEVPAFDRAARTHLQLVEHAEVDVGENSGDHRAMIWPIA